MARGGKRGRRGNAVTVKPNFGVETTKAPEQEDTGGLVFDQRDSFDGNVITIFTGPSSFQQHYDAQNCFRDRYLAVLLTCKSRSISFNEGSKAKALAAAWARNDCQSAEKMLGIPDEEFALKEVLKAVTILDAARAKRAYEKTLRRLEAQGCKKKLRILQVRSLIGSISPDILPVGSLSGALIRHIKKWVKTIPSERLQFFALHFPTEPWKKLADILHLHPEKDVPQCPWFLPFAFGKEIPADVLSSDINADNISAKVVADQIDYSVARKFQGNLTDEAKRKISSYAPIDTVLWYYEELHCPGTDKVLKERLDNGEKVLMTYGKLMDRLSTFVTIREKRKLESIGTLPAERDMTFIENLIALADFQLQTMSLNLESPVVVIGDKSGSMQVAIQTSNIVASLLTKMANADLVFFDRDNLKIDSVPKNVNEVMELSQQIEAFGGTNPAASLYPYYEKKEVIKTFVIVTDEGENETFHQYCFAELFKKYYEEIYPANLVFISFLGYSSHQMTECLKKIAPDIKPMVFYFKTDRPDLTKLDNVIGLLGTKSISFKDEIDKCEAKITGTGLGNTLDGLKI